MNSLFTRYLLEEKGGPIWAIALHDGGEVADALLSRMNLSRAERLREEDPHTGSFADIGRNKLVISSSRFQLDLNRPPDRAIYLVPEQAWGLQVWKEIPDGSQIQELRRSYEYMRTLIAHLIEGTIAREGCFVVFDIHSYNARRKGPTEKIDEQANPQINLGTNFIQDKWRPLTEQFLERLRTGTLEGKSPDARENVKFSGGYLSEWLNKTYGEHGCVLSIEFRKDFMDEWTGEADSTKIQAIRSLLRDAAGFIEKELSKR